MASSLAPLIQYPLGCVASVNDEIARLAGGSAFAGGARAKLASGYVIFALSFACNINILSALLHLLVPGNIAASEGGEAAEPPSPKGPRSAV